jgi:hypothetical protein
VLEEHLYAGNHEEVTYNVHTMYPPWLVAGTSGGGEVGGAVLLRIWWRKKRASRMKTRQCVSTKLCLGMLC